MKQAGDKRRRKKEKRLSEGENIWNRGREARESTDMSGETG